MMYTLNTSIIHHQDRSHGPTDALLDRVLNEVRTFSGERDQEDDQTIVVVGVES